MAVRPLRAHEWALYRHLRLASLTEAPDAFGAVLAEQRDWPDVLWQMRLAAGVAGPDSLPLVAEHAGAPAGLAWGRIEDGAAHVYQVWVAPQARGCGLGAQLVRAVVAWARARQLPEVRLSVALGGKTALDLYLREGFVAHGAQHALRPGSDRLSQPMRLRL